MFQIFLIFVLLIKSGELYRLETIISNFENENDHFIFDKPMVVQRYYETVNKKLLSKFENELMTTDQPVEYNEYLSDFVSRNIMQMAINIQSQIINKPDVKQNVFSPISIASAMSLLLVGSKGQTHEELNMLFGFHKNPTNSENMNQIHNQFGLLIEDLLRDSPHPNRKRPVSKWKQQQNDDMVRYPKYLKNQHKIRIANGLFIQKEFSLRKNYKIMVEKIYRSEIMPVDFQNDISNACKIINEWTKEKTNGKIDKIISSGLNSDTTMVIASALYFKAMWETSFIEVATSKRKFYINGDEQGPHVLVDTMINAGEFPYYECKEYGVRILGIPYKGNMTTMYIILPVKSSRQNLIQIQKLLTADKIEEMISKMEMQTAIITFPKMHIQNSINLKDIFSKIGVTSLFDSEKSDLSLMLDEINETPGDHNDENVPPLIFSRFDDDDKSTETEVLKHGEFKDEYQLRNRRAIIAKDIMTRRRMETDELNSRSTPNLVKKRIFVDDILHKVDLVLNEKGTEGAAATISYLSRNDIEIEFLIDKPFMFFIRHDATKLPIFYGSIFQPIV